jgi:hypothetical protein
VTLSSGEEEELYVLLKPREGALSNRLHELLRRIERVLFERMTVEEIENLAGRFPPGR